MICTFNFVFKIQNNEELRKRIYDLMESEKDEEINISGWKLFFDQERKFVKVTDEGISDYLKVKFIPGEISYDSLVHIMDPDRFGDNYDDWAVNYFY